MHALSAHKCCGYTTSGAKLSVLTLKLRACVLGYMIKGSGFRTKGFHGVCFLSAG